MRSITFWELVEMKIQAKKEAIDDREQTGQLACPCQCLMATRYPTPGRCQRASYRYAQAAVGQVAESPK